jgi:branched-chain amino acid transport system substrate-binding protein
MAAGKTYTDGKLVDLSPTASSTAIVKISPWMFHSSETIPDYIRPLADLTVQKLGKKKIAIVHVETDWGEAVAKTYTQQVAKDGGTIVDEEVYNPGTIDFRATLTKLRRLHPDAIFIAMLEQDAATFMKQRQEFGMGDITVVDSGVGVTERSLKLAGSAFDGLWSDRLFDPAGTLPQTRKFIAAFKAKFGTVPDEWSADGYDGAMIVLQAAERAWPDVTREKIRDELATTGTYVGANGKLTIDPKTREVTRQGYSIVRVENGAIDYDAKP